jgi:putative addiction module component (TIGR02574 family)
VKLAQDIWDSVAEHPESIPVTPAQRAELDRRLEEFERDPDSGSDWSQTRRRIENER